jgi:hypothetical protein
VPTCAKAIDDAESAYPQSTLLDFKRHAEVLARREAHAPREPAGAMVRRLDALIEGLNAFGRSGPVRVPPRDHEGGVRKSEERILADERAHREALIHDSLTFQARYMTTFQAEVNATLVDARTLLGDADPLVERAEAAADSAWVNYFGLWDLIATLAQLRVGLELR